MKSIKIKLKAQIMYPQSPALWMRHRFPIGNQTWKRKSGAWIYNLIVPNPKLKLDTFISLSSAIFPQPPTGQIFLAGAPCHWKCSQHVFCQGNQTIHQLLVEMDVDILWDSLERPHVHKQKVFDVPQGWPWCIWMLLSTVLSLLIICSKTVTTQTWFLPLNCCDFLSQNIGSPKTSWESFWRCVFWFISTIWARIWGNLSPRCTPWRDNKLEGIVHDCKMVENTGKSNYWLNEKIYVTINPDT